MQQNIRLCNPPNRAEISFLSREQQTFLTDPYRFNPHTPDLVPRKEDLTLPVPVDFIWEAGAEFSTIQISDTPEFKTICRQIKGSRRTLKNTMSRFRAKVSNLEHGKTWFWRVTDNRNVSEAQTFTVADQLPRWIRVEHVTNVRDLGNWKTTSGKRIRQGMLFRGAQFDPPWTNQPHGSRLTPKGKKVLMEDLKIHTELGLRGCKGTPLKGIARYELLPFSAYASWRECGIFTDEQMQNVKKIFEIFADRKSYPVYFHCQGGGDRTGTAAFLLETMLGLSEEDCMTEYELSNLSVSGERSRFSREWTQFMAKFQTILPDGSLQEQVCEYLRRCGVSDAMQEKIRSLLLE